MAKKQKAVVKKVTKPKKPTGPVVGLDIGSRWIKAVEVRPEKGKPIITGIGFEPTPEGAIVEEQILDTAGMSAAIKRLFSNCGITGKNVVTSVAGQSTVVVRIIEVPRMTPQELVETMKWEVERHIPFPSSEVVMDYHPLNRPGALPDDQNMEVLLAVSQEEKVIKHIAALTGAKLTPAAVEVEPIALPRSLIQDNPDVADKGTVAIVDLGYDTTNVCIYENKVLVFPRNIPIAGINLTRAVAEALGIEESEAEAAIRQDGVVDMDLINQLNQPPEDDFFNPPADVPDMPAAGSGGETFLGAPLYDPFAGPSEPAEPEDEPVVGPSPFDLDDDEEDSPASASVFDLDAPTAPEPPPASPGGVFDLSEDDEGLPPGPVFTLDEEEPAPSILEVPEEPGQGGEGIFDLSDSDVPVAPADEPQSDQASQLNPDDFDLPEAQPVPTVPALGAHAVGERQRDIALTIAPVVSELASEIHRSLDYFASRNPTPVEAVILCGGLAKLPGLAAFFEGELQIPVFIGDPVGRVPVKSKRYAPEALAEVAPAFATCIGLALRDFIEEGA